MHNQATPNHALHAVLSLCTAGAWILIWIAAALANHPAQCVHCGAKRPAMLGPADRPTLPPASSAVGDTRACRNCGGLLSAAASFCAKCGKQSQIDRECAKCKKLTQHNLLADDVARCNDCGEVVTHAS